VSAYEFNSHASKVRFSCELNLMNVTSHFIVELQAEEMRKFICILLRTLVFVVKCVIACLLFNLRQYGSFLFDVYNLCSLEKH
jgi:hypothetical protein